MRIEITRTTALFPQGQFVQWTVREPTETGDYVFSLDRAGGPDGPWTEILAPTKEQYAVLDRFDEHPTELLYVKPNQLTLYDRVYYRVRVTTPSGARLSAIAETGPRQNEDLGALKLSQVRRHLQHAFRKALKHTGGATILLKRRTWGERCSRCVDPRTKTVVRSDCLNCWGTGYVGGYWSPYFTRARRSASANVTTVTPEQKSDANSVRFWLPDYPQLERDDVIVSLDDQRRFRVDVQLQTELRLVGVHQVVSCQELARDHVVYRLHVDPTTAPQLL